MQYRLPALLIDKTKCLENISGMAFKVKKSDAEFRPHFKTHQSLEVGNWFRDFGVTSITVSSVAMAEYFASAGWEEITIAFPVNIHDTKRLNELSEKCKINILVSAQQVIELIKNEIKKPIGFFIEMDNGYRRSGIPFKEFDVFEDIIFEANGSKLQFKGFHCHPGNTYQAKSKDDILKIHKNAAEQLNGLKIMFSTIYPEIKVSLGDTPSCSLTEHFDDLDIISPGNFVFYDVMQKNLGVCKAEQIAVALAAPIVAVYPERNELVIQAGAVHLSKEFVEMPDKRKTYGLVCLPDGKKWGEPVNGLNLVSLSQEHGIVHFAENFKGKLKVGDIMCILPVHSCLTAACIKQYSDLEGNIIEMMK